MTDQFIIDNSVVMAWCFQDQANKFTDKVLESFATSEAYAPAIWPLEVGNVLLVAERKKILLKPDVIRFLFLIQDLPIVVEQESPDRMWKEILTLARENHLSTYDASYLDLAMRLDLPLATQDKALILAARKYKIPLV